MNLEPFEDLVNYALFVLIPAIPCGLLFWLLRANRSRLTGRLGGLRIDLAGPMAAYVVLLSLAQWQLAPRVIPDRHAITVFGRWDIEFRPSAHAEASRPVSAPSTGRFVIFQDGAGLKLVGALADSAGRHDDFRSSHGMLLDRRLHVLTERTREARTVHGVITADLPENSPRRLNATYLGEDGIANVVLIKRGAGWPIVLAFVILVPLLPAIVLWVVSPGSALRATAPLRGMQLKVGGPIAGYVVVLVLTLGIQDKLLFTSEYREPPDKEATEYDIVGEWCYRNVTDDRPNQTEGEGRAVIDQQGTNITINGWLVEGQRPPAHWFSPLGKVTRDGALVFYFQVRTRADSGIEVGRLLEKKPAEFFARWYDFGQTPGKNLGTSIFRRCQRSPV